MIYPISVKASNEPMVVLGRIWGMLRRRGYPCQSITFIKESSEIIRLTVLLDLSESEGERVCKQLEKLPDIHSVEPFSASATVCRELVLIRIRSESFSDISLAELASDHDVKVLETKNRTTVLEFCGVPAEVDPFLTRISRFQIESIVRSGAASLPEVFSLSN